jgi:hypothetical protein
LYTDDERLKIIQEVYKRPFLWNNESKEAISVSPNVRRQAFTEIATQVSTNSSTLKSEDVERQWKNLKVWNFVCLQLMLKIFRTHM